MDTRSGKLAVILHADVAGSTQMVRKNEHLSHERIQTTFLHFAKTIGRYSGHVLERRGDAMLAEFDRPSDAVAATLAFQKEHAGFLLSIDDDLKPEVRVGIAIGEVVVADNTVTGAGVVMAQRIEQLAKPGGLCITSAVQESLSGRLPIEFNSLGEHEIKGFDDPIKVFEITLVSGHGVPLPPSNIKAENFRNWRKRAGMIAAVIAATAIGFFAWNEIDDQSMESKSGDAALLPLPDKPSIAVLPFTNLGQDSSQEYFADGITEDLITDLSKISGLFVIARNSSFAYKGQKTAPGQIAKALGVRYLLEGSVRRLGNQVRINAQLVDATTGGQVWAERYDGNLSDVFTVQDAVTNQIVKALSVSLTENEMTWQTRQAQENVESHDAYLHGLAHYNLQTPGSYARAIPYFEQALKIDPGYSQAHAVLASLYWEVYQNDWAFNLGILSFEAMRLATEHLDNALLSPTPTAHALKSKMLVASGYYDEALTEASKGLALDPNDAAALEGLANVQILVGKPADAIHSIQKAMRLNPHYPPGYLITLGRAQFAMEDLVNAAATFERAVKRNSENDLPWIYLAATYGHLDRIKDGNVAIELANEMRNRAGQIDVSLRNLPYHRESDFRRFGSRQEQNHVRAGLKKLPSLSWTSLITGSGAGVYSSHAFRTKDFDVKGAVKIGTKTAQLLHEKGAKFFYVGSDSTPGKEQIPGTYQFPEPHSSGRPNQRLSENTLEKVAARTDEIVFYCEDESCFHSAYASAKAIAWGFQKVFYFAEGLDGWKQTGLRVENGDPGQ